MREYEGATVILLDERHFHGSAEDSVSIADGRVRESSLADVALARLVLPDFDPGVMHLLGDKIRLEARELRISKGRRGQARIAVSVHAGDVAVEVSLDPCLRPQDVRVTDELVTRMASWPAEERTRFQEELPDWLGRAYWFGECVGGAIED